MNDPVIVPELVLDIAVGLSAIRAQRAGLEREREDVADQYLAVMSVMKDAGDLDNLIMAMEGFKVSYGTGWAKVAESAGLPTLKALERTARSAYNDGEGMWRGRFPLGQQDVRPPMGTWVVYQLLMGEEMLYIGSTGSFAERIKAHSRNKEFNSWRAAKCENERHCRDLEAALINRHRPPLNRIIPTPRLVLR